MRDFTIQSSADRLKGTGDLFIGILTEGIDKAVEIARAKETFG